MRSELGADTAGATIVVMMRGRVQQNQLVSGRWRPGRTETGEDGKRVSESRRETSPEILRMERARKDAEDEHGC